MCSVQFPLFHPQTSFFLYWIVLIAGTMPTNWEGRRWNILKCRFNLQNVLGHLQDFRKNENILLCNLFWKILNSNIENTQFTPFCCIKRTNKNYDLILLKIFGKETDHIFEILGILLEVKTTFREKMFNQHPPPSIYRLCT